ncbi:MAG: ADP-ribosylglycohydrolase family protein [Campylobacterota bacterium]|nr:ADP-ribosylglycohydrolase family protein [Campylobacterota bacterium]
MEQNYYFDETCQGSVPEAIISFLESTDFESSIKNAIWLKGDADTQACIAGAIAEAYYKEIPRKLITKALDILPKEFIVTIDNFYKTIDHQFKIN